MSVQGIVVRDEGNLVHVDTGGETPIAAVIRKSLRHRTTRRSKPVVVGDRVTLEASGDGYAVCRVEPRKSVLSRRSPGQRRREHVLVANIDAVLVVAALRNPDLAPGLIDRFLVAAESRGFEAAIAFNKLDLIDQPGPDHEPYRAHYESLGYAVFETSAEQQTGLPAVREFMRDNVTTMVGHSGVGKSSLANAIDPSLDLRTGEVHEKSGQGQHTTTSVSLLKLPWGGYVVDTPGIREFGLWDMELADLGIWFREFADRADHCRFNDCLHEKEPGCAILNAVEHAEIPPWRYESYRRILDSLREARADTY